MPRSCISSPHASVRLAAARDWLKARSPAEEVLVVAPSPDAGSELLRELVVDVGAAFGWHRITMGRLAGELAQPMLLAEGLVPIGPLGVEALVARVVHELAGTDKLDRYADATTTPGFARAAARTIQELRMAGVEPGVIASDEPGMALILATYEALLGEQKLADRALVFGLASKAAELRPGSALLGLPTLLLDLPVRVPAEETLLAVQAGASPEVLATVPSGDDVTLRRLEKLGFSADDGGHDVEADLSVAQLTAHLFEDAPPPVTTIDDSVVILSAPGESRECVEIARQLLACARSGVSFDRMAVLLRSVEEYRPHLEEAFARAGIPAHFAQGTVRPDPAGRAFLALVACAVEALSARRFAEYLSLAQVPDATGEGQPPSAPPPGDRWVAPDEELVSPVVAEALTGAESSERTELRPTTLDSETAPVVDGTLRAPRRWEQLLVEAAVIGGRDRWERRLAGLDEELHLDLAEVDDPEGPEGERLRRQMADLRALRDFALPLIDELASLPDSATWGIWIERLSALTTRALREPWRVLAVLSELVPMAQVRGVGLREVQLVLSRRLLEIAIPPPRSRFGSVYVGAAESVRGMTFEVVSVPGLAEKLFPREIREDPLLLDRVRRTLGLDLETNDDRVGRERLTLRLAVGAPRSRIVLSYPRLDLEKGRPRVPSFYGLEAVRAAEGHLPGFADLASRAESVVEARVGWPAPARPQDAIDEAEHDLALLDAILRQDEARSIGTARYLLSVNPHLGRALRFRARRWLRRWTAADGLVLPSAEAREALTAHEFGQRSYSATALEHYAACPYRFFLQAIHRLSPREVPEHIDDLNPLQRGSLVHEVQFDFFRRLKDEDLLPVTDENLAMVRSVLDEVVTAVASRFHEALAPAIERVWDDGIAAVRADLRAWLRHLAGDGSGFVPSHFELAFGLASGRSRDPLSSEVPVALDCGIQLRGSIDLVERHPRGEIRVTDHKTGKVRLSSEGIFGGGSVLQPALYSLAAEKLFPEASVVEGRLSYCTAAGGFEVRSVPLDVPMRQSAAALAEALGEALAAGFLPAFPKKDACRYCDYQVICGPYEEFRTQRKPPDDGPLARLNRLRDMP